MIIVSAITRKKNTKCDHPSDLVANHLRDHTPEVGINSTLFSRTDRLEALQTQGSAKSGHFKKFINYGQTVIFDTFRKSL